LVETPILAHAFKSKSGPIDIVRKIRDKATMSHRVATIAYDGIRPFHLSVPCLIFGEDRTPEGMPATDFKVCAETPNTVLSTESGLGLVAPFGLDAVADAEIVIMPSWRSKLEPVPAAITDVLQAAHRRGALVVGLCLGAFPLAAAGLLNGRSATTHWQATAELALQYPNITVLADRLYVDEGDVMTSAGVAASLDCCLHLVRQRFGVAAARNLARRIVLSPHRQGGQAQFIEQPVPAAARVDLLAKAMDHVLANLEATHELDSICQRAGMTRRTFTRHFYARTGMSFARWLRSQRLIFARQMLEETNRPIEDVATLAGFGTATSLRQHFAAVFKTTPTRHRREFCEHSI
jgi:AraC family transcriptional regulator, transcriptional activator FtrA